MQSASYSISDLVSEDRVHRLVYVDPDIFELEMKRIFYNTWVFVGHESEVAHPGDYKTMTLGRQPVILTRDTSGKIFVLFNRCAHRAAIVCRQERGTSSYFRCLYHGWTYSNNGELVGVPFRSGYGEDFNTEEFGLVRVPHVQSYRGFVFASLNPDTEPFEEYIGRAKAYLDLIIDRAPEGAIEVTKGVHKTVYHGNWKFLLENWVDSYHPSFTHEAAFERRRYRTGRSHGLADEGSENVDLGRGHAMIHYSAGKTRRAIDAKVDTEHLATLKERLGSQEAEEVLDRSNINLALFPNLLLSSPYQHFRVIRPVRVDYTEVFIQPYRLLGVADDENNRQVRRVGNLTAGMVQPDDLEAFERIQEGLSVEAVEWVLFNRGVHRERVEPSGEIRGMGADEVGDRGQHREWKRLMLQERCK